jgi:hypothetical protein
MDKHKILEEKLGVKLPPENTPIQALSGLKVPLKRTIKDQSKAKICERNFVQSSVKRAKSNILHAVESPSATKLHGKIAQHVFSISVEATLSQTEDKETQAGIEGSYNSLTEPNILIISLQDGSWQ